MSEFISREHMRDELRKNMPGTAAIADEFRKVFGNGIRITYAEEGGNKVGTPMNLKQVGVAHNGAKVVTYAGQRRDA